MLENERLRCASPPPPRLVSVRLGQSACVVDGPYRKPSRVLPASRRPRNRDVQRDTFHRHDAGNQYNSNIPHRRDGVKLKSKKKAEACPLSGGGGRRGRRGAGDGLFPAVLVTWSAAIAFNELHERRLLRYEGGADGWGIMTPVARRSSAGLWRWLRRP